MKPNYLPGFRWFVTRSALGALLLTVFLCWPSDSFSQSAYLVYPVKAITDTRILPQDGMSGYTEGSTLSLSAAPDEYEAGSFVIRANSQLVNFLPSAGDLESEGNRIAASNIDIKLVKVWYQGCSNNIHYQYCENMGGQKKVLVPELLLNDSTLVTVDAGAGINRLRVTTGGSETYVDITSAETIDSATGHGPDLTLPEGAEIRDAASLQPANIEAGHNQQYWVTVHVPAGTPGGEYKGNITLTAQGQEDRNIELKLRVWPFALAEPVMEYGLYYRGYIARETPTFFDSDKKTAAQVRAEITDMRRHGVVSNSCTQSTWPPELFQEYLQIRNDVGMKNTLYMLWSGTYIEKPDSFTNLKSLAEAGGHSDLYLYGGDELSPEEAAESTATWDRMRESGAKIFSALTISAATPVISHLDLSIVSGERDVEFARLAHSHGQRAFSYGRPQVGEEEPETYRRSYGFALWKDEYDGEMNYAYQDAWGSMWNDFDGYFRDHVFAYPVTDGVIDTTQWEGFREAVDDVRYLSTLLQAISEAPASDDKTEAQNWLSSFNTDGDLDVVRAQIVEYILTLKGLSLKPGPPKNLRVSG